MYMAVSQDGFIAGPDDETPWSDAEWESFHAFVLSCDVVLLGRRTYEIMRANDEFVDGPQYLVVTDDPGFDAGDFGTVAITSKGAMPVADKVGIIGGGELNGRLASLGVVDEIILDVEPIKLGSGTRLFGKHDVPLKLEPIGSKQIGEATMQRHYRVVG
jgi:dihydrofolate reductase